MDTEVIHLHFYRFLVCSPPLRIPVTLVGLGSQGNTDRRGGSYTSADRLAYGPQAYATYTPTSAGLTKTRLPLLDCGQMNRCTNQITASGVICSISMAAPCIIDDGASCRTVANYPHGSVRSFHGYCWCLFGGSTYTALFPVFRNVLVCSEVLTTGT